MYLVGFCECKDLQVQECSRHDWDGEIVYNLVDNNCGTDDNVCSSSGMIDHTAEKVPRDQPASSAITDPISLVVPKDQIRMVVLRDPTGMEVNRDLTDEVVLRDQAEMLVPRDQTGMVVSRDVSEEQTIQCHEVQEPVELMIDVNVQSSRKERVQQNCQRS